MTKSVPSIERALSVMEVLAGTRRGLTLSDLSRKVNMPKSSAHYILRALVGRGYVVHDAVFNTFALGVKLFDLGTVVLDRMDLRTTAAPYLEALTADTRITSHLAILDRGEAVFVAKIEAPGLVRIATWVGHRRPINVTAVGKSLVAFLPEPEQEQVIRACAMPRHTSRTITTRARLRAELETVRTHGFALDDEEDEAGIRCVAAPVLDTGGRSAAAISLTGPTSQITRERLSDLTQATIRTASAVSAAIARSGGWPCDRGASPGVSTGLAHPEPV